MRLFFVTQDFPPETGGIQTYSYEHAKALAESAEHITVIAPAKAYADKWDNAQPFNIRRVSISNTLLFLPLLFRFSFWAKTERVSTVIHAQWQTVLPSVIAKKLGIIKHIVIAAHARELLFNPFGATLLGRVYHRYMKWLLSNGDLFIPVSEYTNQVLLDLKVPKKNSKVLINGTDPSKFYPIDVSKVREQKGLDSSFVLLTVTRLVERKGIDTVLEALSILKEEVSDIKYLIVGDGVDRQKLMEFAKLKEVDQFVTFCGKVPYDELNTYYNLCDLFVMPSKTATPDVEGFGIVFLEANACAKPVIGTYSGGIPSAIIHEKTGLLVEEDNPKELSKAIMRLYTNQTDAQQLGKQGLQRVKEEANWSALSKKLYHHLELLNKQSE